ncbi:hypothetical protein [Synechococcus sp. PROS-U-1]|uniref:hypothetical protein n=1 Tax=Synechococcus sp. PROS-U-1 TaxID=1400866 RepID=UPI001648E683|nr:hypothetical protein [Synechococcus sp. PROS-U-1]
MLALPVPLLLLGSQSPLPQKQKLVGFIGTTMGVAGLLFIVLVITVFAGITTMLLAITVAEMLLPVPTEHVLVVITVVVAAFVIDAESGSLMPKTRG